MNRYEHLFCSISNAYVVNVHTKAHPIFFVPLFVVHMCVAVAVLGVKTGTCTEELSNNDFIKLKYWFHK